ncbi:hypothetical protein [Marinobacter sp. P4B1]|uniref:hypothetical protein n=1 Tax=Marinobacter sp. P4B1 TaxID=1119533 RepID=UPI00071E1FBA|nr:hypothetical protein [Marinobacter sp. P4B1]KRW83623.1 hypothetical protein AQ621_16375 [Marinobacter sp. P4B1]
MSLRIASAKELASWKGQGMSSTVASQLEAHLKDIDRSKKKLERLESRHRKSPELEDQPYSALPPTDPAIKLYRACVKRWGRFQSGGDVLMEVLVVPGRKFRLDIAWPKKKLGAEHDGWEFHGKHLEDFKKDREKYVSVTAQGWSILPISSYQARFELEETLDLIQQALDARPDDPNFTIRYTKAGYAVYSETS